MIDFANSQGGTSTTGNVTRRCFLRTDDNDKDFLYWVLSTIPADYKEVVTEIHTYLGAILRVYNSGRQIDTEELSGVQYISGVFASTGTAKTGKNTRRQNNPIF